MPLMVREVDLSAEMPRLVDVFNEGFGVAIPRERFEWLYQRNPDGAATAWFVVDDRNDAIAGCTAVFPRRIQVRGQSTPTLAWNCGDFCILPRYRAGAAAIKLRQAARDAVRGGVVPFLYAHPNDRMLQIHLRVGHQPLGRMIRLARPTMIKRDSLAGRIGTIALRAARHDRFWPGGDDHRCVSGELPAGIDALFDAVRPRLGTALIRDSRYLSWRFVDCPMGDFRFIVTRRKGEITGYLVYESKRGQLNIKDWLGIDARAVRALFTGAVDEACKIDAASASVTLLETHRDLPVIRRAGFVRRPETSTAITYAADSVPWRPDVTSADAWYMTVGDRDI
jgi:hypothetical protein